MCIRDRCKSVKRRQGVADEEITLGGNDTIEGKLRERVGQWRTLFGSNLKVK